MTATTFRVMPCDVNLRRVGDMQVELIGLLAGRW